MSGKRTLTLASDLDELPKLEAFIEEIYTSESLSDDLFGDVMLAVTEGVTNAIVHGNEFDPTKHVEVTAEVDAEALVMTIRDFGRGFNPDKLPDPLQEKNLLKSGGRGVYLMRQFADDVQFEDNATLVRIRFNKNK